MHICIACVIQEEGKHNTDDPRCRENPLRKRQLRVFDQPLPEERVFPGDGHSLASYSLSSMGGMVSVVHFKQR